MTIPEGARICLYQDLNGIDTMPLLPSVPISGPNLEQNRNRYH